MIHMYAAQGIAPDSWLNDDDRCEPGELANFRYGYAYASNMTRAIPALSKISAEEAYWIWWGINHGIERRADFQPQGLGNDEGTEQMGGQAHAEASVDETGAATATASAPEADTSADESSTEDTQGETASSDSE